MINLNGSNVSEMYYGSTKIGEAYLGSALVYQQDKKPLSDTYTLLWSGDAHNNITLSEPYSGYDALRFICQNSCNNVTVPTAVISNLGHVDLTEPTYKTPNDQPLFSIRGQRFKFNADMKTCGAVSSFVKSWVNPNSVWNNNLYYNWTKIYGVKYADN